MINVLNKLLVKAGLLITRAPTLVADPSAETSDLLPAELTERSPVKAAEGTPDNELFRIFADDTNVHKWHHYFDIYTRHFQQYRDRPIRMLEIGVFRGGSLRMWKKFFHPDSTIVGIDINPECKAHELPDQNVHVRIGSQADPDFLAKINEEFGPFDVILDDGSHQTDHMIVSFGALFRAALKDGGCYMVEDTHTNYWTSYVNSAETFIDLSKQMVDVMHEPYFGDRSETSFRMGHANEVKSLALSYLSANLAGIAFYDSIIVFDKKKHGLPKSELR